MSESTPPHPPNMPPPSPKAPPLQVVHVPRTFRPHADVAAHFNLPQRLAILLHPRRACVPDPFASKMGGTPAWPTNEPWPICQEHDEVHVAVLQLTQHDIPELRFPPSKDLLQLTWCADDHAESEDHGPEVAVFWRSLTVLRDLPLRNAVPRPTRDDVLHKLAPHECALHPERLPESSVYCEVDRAVLNNWLLQHAQADMRRMRVPPELVRFAYEAFFSTASGTKVAGFPPLLRDVDAPECKQCRNEMTYMLTVSDRDCGDEVGCFRWAPRDCRDQQGRPLVSPERGSGLAFGSGGAVFLFMCMLCEGCPVTSIFQDH